MNEPAGIVDTAREAPYECDVTPVLLWARDQDGPSDIELACSGHGDPCRGPRRSLVVQLPGCAADVSASSYLELIAAGVHELSVAVCGCPRADVTAQHVAKARRLLQAAGSRARLDCTSDARGRGREVFPLHRLPLSRRRLLRWAVPHTAAAHAGDDTERARAISALQSVRAARQLTHPVAEQPLAATAVAASSEIAPSVTAPSPDGLAAVPAACADLVATDCTGCGVCVRACPLGALHVEGYLGAAGEQLTLRFTARLCTDCGRCTELCPDGALVRAGALSWHSLVQEPEAQTLATCTIRRCTRCGTAFSGAPEQTHCPVCAFRIASPFGSYLPRRASRLA